MIEIESQKMRQEELSNRRYLRQVCGRAVGKGLWHNPGQQPAARAAVFPCRVWR